MVLDATLVVGANFSGALSSLFSSTLLPPRLNVLVLVEFGAEVSVVVLLPKDKVGLFSVLFPNEKAGLDSVC